MHCAHPNIVRLFGVSLHERVLHLVTDFVEFRLCDIVELRPQPLHHHHPTCTPAAVSARRRDSEAVKIAITTDLDGDDDDDDDAPCPSRSSSSLRVRRNPHDDMIMEEENEEAAQRLQRQQRVNSAGFVYSVEVLLRVASQMFAAVGHMHAKGVHHRDLKPQVREDDWRS